MITYDPPLGTAAEEEANCRAAFEAAGPGTFSLHRWHHNPTGDLPWQAEPDWAGRIATILDPSIKPTDEAPARLRNFRPASAEAMKLLTVWGAARVEANRVWDAARDEANPPLIALHARECSCPWTPEHPSIFDYERKP